MKAIACYRVSTAAQGRSGLGLDAQEAAIAVLCRSAAPLQGHAGDDLGRRAWVMRGDGVGSSYGYDGVSRPASLSHDPAGTAQDLTLGFTYNPAGQIVSRSVSNGAYVYTPVNAAVAYANDLLNRLTAINGSSVGYDADGNLTTAPGAAYGYDALNQLTSSTTALGSAAFAYDPTGRLYRSTGSADRRFLYDGQQVIGEYNDSNVIQNRYVPDLGLDDVVAGYAGSGTSNRTWLLADERQSVIALTDGAGVASAVNTYDDYGVPGAGNTGRFQYTGQMWLADAGLYHYRARAYAPQIGRFLQTDPMGYQAGMNLYAYVGGDPVNRIDPMGLAEGPITFAPCIPPVCTELPGPNITGSPPWTEWVTANEVPTGDDSPGFGGPTSSVDDVVVIGVRRRGGGVQSSSDPTNPQSPPGRRPRPMPDQEERWRKEYEAELRFCDTLNSPRERRICRSNAIERYGNRIAGRPEGPLRQGDGPSLTIAGVTLTGGALALYISEGSRLFPPRNLIPVP